MMNRMLRRLEQKRARNDKGLTLVELLVVITILGILAAVIVVSVSGIGDKGKAAAATTESDILRVAQETYCTTNGSYATIQQLRTNNIVERDPGYYGTNAYSVTDSSSNPNGVCGNTRFYVGPTSVYAGGDSGDPLFYSASNNTFPWSYLAPEFIGATDAAGKPVNGSFRVRFDASGTLKTAANTTGDVASMLASADLENTRDVVPTAQSAVVNGVTISGDCPATAPNTCRGIASTLTRYTIGQLVMFSCRSAGGSLPPADGGTKRCSKPDGSSSYVADPPATLTALAARIAADPNFKIAIPTPTAGTAPYGVAAAAALATVGITLPHAQVVTTNPADNSSMNVSVTQRQVLDGKVSMAFVPKSFVVSPGGIDSHYWSDVPISSHPAIEQWGVVLETPGSAAGIDTAQERRARDFLAYLASDFAQQALVNGYGYIRATP